MNVLLAYSLEGESMKGMLEELCPGIAFSVASTYDEATEKLLAEKPELVVSHMLFNGMVIKDGRVLKSKLNVQPGSANVTDLYNFVKTNPQLENIFFVIYTLGDLTMARETCPGAAAYIVADKSHSLKQLADTIQKAAE